MTTYTDEQKIKIRQMPAAVLLESMLVDSGSAVVSMREFVAGEKFISEASTQYPGNALIQDMAKNVNLPKLEELVQHVFNMGDTRAMHTECQKKINDGLTVLGHDAEADQFKTFLVATAEKVVNAAGEGFFGNQGSKVSTNEAAYINQLKQQLGSAPPPAYQ